MAHKKVLFVRFSSLGDIITSNYYAMKIKEKHPEWHLTWLVDVLYEPLVKIQPWVDAVIAWDRKNTGNWGFLKILKKVRSENYDVLVDMHGSDRMAFFTFFSLIPVKYGLKHDWITFGLHDSNDFSELLDEEDKIYLSPKYLYSGRPVDATVCLIHQTHAKTDRVFILAIGASFRKKRWPVDSWVKFIDIAAVSGVHMVLVGTGQEEVVAAEEIMRNISRGHITNLVGKLSILELIQIIDSGDVLISGDTGPLHIARALGIKTIGLFGPTLVEKKYMEHLSHVFYSDCEDIECENWDCSKPCLETIPPLKVFLRAEELLQGI